MKKTDTQKRTRDHFPDDALDCLRALIKKHGLTGKESDDAKALGPILRLSGHPVDDEKIRNRLKNCEYTHYKESHPDWTPVPKKPKKAKVETPTVKKEKEPSSDNDSNFVVEEGEDSEEEEEQQQSTRSFAARNNSSNNAMEIVQPEQITILDSPRLCEPLDVFGTDTHVWVVAYKTSQRDFKMGVVDNPNGVGAWPSKVMRITESVHPVTTDIMMRLTNGIEHTFHEKPQLAITYCQLPPQAVAFAKIEEVHDDYVHGLRFIRKVLEPQEKMTQMSIETAMQPICLGAPTCYRQITQGGLFPQLQSHPSSTSEKDEDRGNGSGGGA